MLMEEKPDIGSNNPSVGNAMRPRNQRRGSILKNHRSECHAIRACRMRVLAIETA